jgi:hypothetical protein
MPINIVAQRYYGNVTITPRYSLDHYRHMLRDPNKDRWHWFRLQGERATWPKIAMIRAHSRISQTLTDCIEKLKHQRQRRREDRRPSTDCCQQVTPSRASVWHRITTGQSSQAVRPYRL